MIIQAFSPPKPVISTRPFQHPAKALQARPVQAQARLQGDQLILSSGQLQPVPIPVEGQRRQPIQKNPPVQISLPRTEIQRPPETEASFELKDMTPLGQAVFRGQNDAVDKLLSSLSDKEINTPDANGFTPLAVAVRYGKDAIVDKLLENKKVDAVKPNQDGRTPLILAARYGRTPLIQKLLRHAQAQKHVNVQDKNGATALDFVANNRDAHKMLKAAGGKTATELKG